MEELLSECALLDFKPVRSRKGMGGPSSADGKRRSSQNSRTHGCRSQERILPGESREDYDAVAARWFAEYRPESECELAHVQRVVDAEWRLQRTERRYTDVERALHGESEDAAAWSEGLLQRLQVMQRYRTGAENSLHKELRLLEMLKQRRDAEERRTQREREEQQKLHPEQAAAEILAQAKERAAALLERAGRPEELFAGQGCVAPEREVVLEQCAEIRVVAGRTVTELVPTNAELVAMGQAMLPPPTVVVRELSFFDGVPAEYDWVGLRDEVLKELGGTGLQRMTVEDWVAVVEREEAQGDGHLLPVPVWRGDGLERLGVCRCPICLMRGEVWKQAQAHRWG